MLKRFIIIVVILLMLFTSAVYANDGGAYVAGDELLEITIKPKTSTAQIGQEFTVQVIMKNNDKYPIFLDEISEIFKGQRLFIEDKDIQSLDTRIMPGTTVYFDVTFIVDETIEWYIKDGKYYADIDPFIVFWAITYEPPKDEMFEPEDYSSDYYWHFYYKGFKPIPVEITNINNGERYININLKDDTKDIYFYEMTGEVNNAYDGEYAAQIEKNVFISNMGNKNIEQIYSPSFIWWKKEDNIFYLEKDSEIVHKIKHYYEIKPDEIPETVSTYYRATFMIDNKYYGVIIEEELQTHLLHAPALSFNFSEVVQSGQWNKYAVTIKNTSNDDYDNFIYYVDGESNNIEDVYNNPNTLSHGNCIEADVYFDADRDEGDFRVGFIIDGFVYTWPVYFDYENGKISDAFMHKYLTSYHVSEYFDYLSPTATKSPNATPIPTDTPPPTQEITPTAHPTSTATTTAKIEKTAVRSNVPAWVYFAVIVAVIAAGIMVYLNARHNKNNTDN